MDLVTYTYHFQQGTIGNFCSHVNKPITTEPTGSFDIWAAAQKKLLYYIFKKQIKKISTQFIALFKKVIENIIPTPPS